MESGADHLLIAAYLEGEEGAAREVDRWIRREIEIVYPGLRSEIEDLCQAVHGKLLDSLRAGRFEHRSTLKTYVGRITRYTAIDLIRRSRRERRILEEWTVDAVAGAAAAREDPTPVDDQVLLDQILLNSPAPCRELWRMVFVEKLSYAEIARRLSIPPGTVKSRMWHCRRKAMALLRLLRGGRAPGSRGRQGDR